MRKFTPEEKEKLQAMIGERNRSRKKRKKAYLRHKASAQTVNRMSGSRFFMGAPSLESAMHRKESHRDVRYSKNSELKRMKLTEKEKEELKDKVWGKIRERHKS